MYYINILKQAHGSAKTYEYNSLDDRSVVDRHRCHMTAKFGAFVDEKHDKLPTIYWFLNFIKDHMNHILLLILVPVLLLSCLNF